MFLIVVEFFCSKLLHRTPSPQCPRNPPHPGVKPHPKKIVRLLLRNMLNHARCCGGGYVVNSTRSFFLQLKSLLLVVCSTGQGVCHFSARPIQNPPDADFRVLKEKLGEWWADSIISIGKFIKNIQGASLSSSPRK